MNPETEIQAVPETPEPSIRAEVTQPLPEGKSCQKPHPCLQEVGQ